MVTITLHNNSAMNSIMTRYHYLHRPVIKSKLLSYGIRWNGNLVGGLIWATCPFTKKNGLIGPDQPYDKWEVLVLARFFKLDGYSHIAPTTILAECLGKRIKHRRNILPVGWRLQQDWVNLHPPRYPNNPFVPRLLLSWSDLALPQVVDCPVCHRMHNGNHTGIIYEAAGWERYDQTTNIKARFNSRLIHQDHIGLKQSWIKRLDYNEYAYQRGLANYYTNCEDILW